MDDNRSLESQQAQYAQRSEDQRRIRKAEERHHYVSLRYSYQMKMGRVTIKLDPVEFRILRFLASHPYRAFSRKRIAKAVSTRRHPVSSATLDHHIARLRNALGFFRDYIQTVPYIGYRFKE